VLGRDSVFREICEGDGTMMGMPGSPERLFYDFCLEDHVPYDHLLRQVDRFLDLDGARRELRPFYSPIGRPSVDPELMIRMLLIGYCLGIRSERRLCEEVHLNLAYRWFCRLGLDGKVPDHSTFSVNAPAVSGRATCCAMSSRALWVAASWKGWWAAKASRSMPA
jgi:transposase-like protein DUF772